MESNLVIRTFIKHPGLYIFYGKSYLTLKTGSLTSFGSISLTTDAWSVSSITHPER